MKINDYLEKIHQYLAGELDETSKKEFEQELEKDPDLRKLYLTEKKILEGIQAYGQKESKKTLSEVERSLEDEGFFSKSENSRNTTIIIMKRIISVAAVIVVVLVGAWLVLRNGDNAQEQMTDAQIFEEYFANDDQQLDQVIESLESYGFAGGATAEDTLKQALELQRRGKYQQSCKLLDSFVQLHPENDTALFYLGIGYLNSNQYGSAVETLSKVIEMDQSNFVYDAKWNLALSYLMVENGRAEAISLIKDLTNDPGYTDQETAVSMLQLLE